jgi:hypothetical protein
MLTVAASTRKPIARRSRPIRQRRRDERDEETGDERAELRPDDAAYEQARRVTGAAKRKSFSASENCSSFDLPETATAAPPRHHDEPPSEVPVTWNTFENQAARSVLGGAGLLAAPREDREERRDARDADQIPRLAQPPKPRAHGSSHCTSRCRCSR